MVGDKVLALVVYHIRLTLSIPTIQELLEVGVKVYLGRLRVNTVPGLVHK